MASKASTAGTAVPTTEGKVRGVDMKGQIHVSELISDRAAAPSPFGDDQTFPLPIDRITYIPLSNQ
ncbi:hypothetical protein [Actinoplanes sp. NPDC051851]|uniref:hypothetical protein n=1 Tax=Actinoplanes sp. NPDC051851 TaxID=3154753 RepID=UPI0034241ADE